MPKKDTLKKLNTRNINNLNGKKAFNNHLKSENKELRYELTENLENFKEQATRLEKCIVENGTLKISFLITKLKLESWEMIKWKKKKKKNEYDIWSFILTELEDLREQFNFLGNDKLLLKEQLDNFKSNKIQLFKKGQFCNGTCAV